MTIEQILDYKLKKLIGNEKFNIVTQDDKDFVLAQAKTKIQNYCHRLDIPKGAYYVWADMAVELLKGIEKSLFTTTVEGDLMDRVTSVKAGDTTISFAKEAEDNESNDDLQSDAILVSLSKQLQSFRKFPKGSDCNGI